MNLSCQKELFSLNEGIHYLNCAYKAPLLKSAEAIAHEALIEQRTPSNLKPIHYFEDAETVRGLFAKIVNTSAQGIAILPATTYGFSSVLNNVEGKTGGKAITLENEFPSGYFSVERWCKENSNSLQVIGVDANSETPAKDWNEALLNAIDETTSVLLMSSIHWMNGTVFNLEAIGRKCREVGAVFMVDGTQSVGVLEMDVQKYHIDALICATYKWLFGPYSTALAYIGDRFSKGRPLEESWINRTNAMQFSSLTDYDPEYKPGAGRYNVGQTSHFILMPMLKVALQQVLDWEPKRIRTYCDTLIQPLKEYLNGAGVKFELDAFSSSHLFSLRLPEVYDTDALQKQFSERNISVSLRGTNIRVSLNVFNTQEDIQILIAAIDASKS